MNHEPTPGIPENRTASEGAAMDAAQLAEHPPQNPETLGAADEPHANDIEVRHNQIELGQDSARAIQFTLGQMPREEDQQRILSTYLRVGPPFAAFLLLEDTDPVSATVTDQFSEVYLGSWAHLDQLIADTIEGLGWYDALTEIRETYGIDPSYLTWNYRELAVRLRDMYDIVELDGYQHVFLK